MMHNKTYQNTGYLSNKYVTQNLWQLDMNQLNLSHYNENNPSLIQIHSYVIKVSISKTIWQVPFKARRS